MKIITIIILLIVTLLICQCKKSKKEHSHFPRDFAFKYKTDAYTYNSRTQLYTRQYSDSTASLKVSLTEKELQSIFNDIQEFEFMNFPEEFECEKEGTFTVPSFTSSIVVTFNKQVKQSTNNTICTRQTDSNNFFLMQEKIYRILSSKKEVQTLPRTDILYM